MKLSQSKALERPERIRHFVLFTIALAAAIATAACQNQPATNTNTNTPNTAPTTTGTPTKGNRTLGETPIVVTGGSAYLDLSNSTFTKCPAPSGSPCPTPSPATNDEYFADGQIIAGYYFDDDNNPNETPTPIPIPSPGGDVTIVIECKETGGPSPTPGSTPAPSATPDSATITIRSIAAANRVYVDFDETNKFKQRTVPTGNSNLVLERRVSKKLKVESITVNGGAKINLPNKVTVVLLGK